MHILWTNWGELAMVPQGVLCMAVIPRTTEDRNHFKVLRAFRHPRIPWGITTEGWRFFLAHEHPTLRKAAEAHPYSGQPVYKVVGAPVRAIKSNPALG